MAEISIEKINEVYLRIFSEPDVEQELFEHFSFFVEGYRWMPLFKSKMWDGKVHLYDQRRKTIYTGLYNYIVDFANKNNHEITVTPNEFYGYPFSQDSVSEETIEEYINSLQLQAHGEQIEIKDYQLEAVIHGITNFRALVKSPTGSGKSLIIYCLMRWLIEQGHKVILIVPSVALVEQMWNDFADYSSSNGWEVDENCQKLYSGFSKQLNSNVLITTWQSVYKEDAMFFNQFSVMFGDESHEFKAKSLVSILEKMTDIKYRFGTTGTLDDKKVNKLVLEGLLGPVYVAQTTKNLMDNKELANLSIKCLLLRHSDEVCKVMKNLKYHDEINYLIGNEQRNRFICNLAESLTGNTLILFQFIDKHGVLLYDRLTEKVGTARPLHFIHGNVLAADREEIRTSVQHGSNAILVASYGTFSRGINIPSLKNIIFASPYKSKVKVLQSIGRELRITEEKQNCYLYDVADDMHWKAKKNHTLEHFIVRMKMYAEEQFKFKVFEIKL